MNTCTYNTVGILFDRLPPCADCPVDCGQDTAFVILPLPSNQRRRGRLIEALKQIKQKGVGTGLWIPVSDGRKKNDKMLAYLKKLPKGILTYPVLLRAGSRISRKEQSEYMAGKLYAMGFYPMLWLVHGRSSARRIHQWEGHGIDICCAQEACSVKSYGFRVEEKKHCLCGRFCLGHTLHSAWEYAAFIKEQGWNGL